MGRSVSLGGAGRPIRSSRTRRYPIMTRASSPSTDPPKAPRGRRSPFPSPLPPRTPRRIPSWPWGPGEQDADAPWTRRSVGWRKSGRLWPPISPSTWTACSPWTRRYGASDEGWPRADRAHRRSLLPERAGGDPYREAGSGGHGRRGLHGHGPGGVRLVLLPHSIYTAPPYELPPALVWFQSQNRSSRGLARLLQTYAGKTLYYKGYECPDEGEAWGKGWVWHGCAIAGVSSPPGSRWRSDSSAASWSWTASSSSSPSPTNSDRTGSSGGGLATGLVSVNGSDAARRIRPR
jgi:hypothetical protein